MTVVVTILFIYFRERFSKLWRNLFPNELTI